jgi:prepilin-type N-terminal cleavage/methylation domain-containing protein/prepilin-type processing-associated H-X9-DG protein
MLKTHHEHRVAYSLGLPRAFTLIEVLVVVAIIALLVSILLPSLATARTLMKSTVCLSQLRQMAIAAQAYTTSFSASYPPSQHRVTVTGPTTSMLTIDNVWDFTVITDMTTGQTVVRPGLLWQGKTLLAIQQCPSFSGEANWADNPYTGYNYNTSYVGTFQLGKKKIMPARQDRIRRPARCAVFGDGEYSGNANKFMRSPWGSEYGARDTGATAGIRAAGTQGYRHQKKTNVSFADGHAESLSKRFTNTYELTQPDIAENCGFLSADNSMYSLE